MPSEMFLKNIALQDKVYGQIFQQGELNENNEKEPSLFLSEFAKYGDLVAEEALGDLGVKLFELTTQLDFDHPEVKSTDFMLAKSSETFERLHQIVKLYLLARDNNLTAITNQFSKKIAKSVIPDIKSCLELIKNKQFVRLFTQDSRDYYRQKKEIRSIELVSKKMIGFWDRVSEATSYARFENYCEKEIEKITKKIQVYEQLRMNALVSEMETSIKEFNETYDDNYYGFQRVPMTIIAIVLAKLHNCYMVGESQIMVPANNFIGFNGIAPPVGFAENGIGLLQKMQDYQYMPAAYPATELIISDKMKSVLDHLDSFPEANNKAIFDHFVVVVPGVWATDPADPLLKGKSYSNTFSMKVSLDQALIQEQYVLPILLGEKDGKCYFICFWE